jgi:hypothetical protein
LVLIYLSIYIYISMMLRSTRRARSESGSILKIGPP